jgi:hypothetical protein
MVHLVEQELITNPEHISSHPVISGILVAQSLVFCVVFAVWCSNNCINYFADGIIQHGHLFIYSIKTKLEYTKGVIRSRSREEQTIQMIKGFNIQNFKSGYPSETIGLMLVCCIASLFNCVVLRQTSVLPLPLFGNNYVKKGRRIFARNASQ